MLTLKITVNYRYYRKYNGYIQKIWYSGILTWTSESAFCKCVNDTAKWCCLSTKIVIRPHPMIVSSRGRYRDISFLHSNFFKIYICYMKVNISRRSFRIIQESFFFVRSFFICASLSSFSRVESIIFDSLKLNTAARSKNGKRNMKVCRMNSVGSFSAALAISFISRYIILSSQNELILNNF